MRVGLVGTGYWAAEVHAPAVVAAGHELTAVWGRDAGRAEALASRHEAGAFAGEDRLDPFLDGVDALTFAVPPDVQAPIAVRAAQAGRHLLLEKPTGLSVEQADGVADAVEAAGVASVVFFTARHTPAVADWLDGLRARGGWTGAHGAWLGSIFTDGSPFGASPWRHEHGGLWDVGPHALSVLVGALGPVTSVSAVRGPGDTVHLVLRHGDGQDAPSSTASVSLTVPPDAAALRCEVYGQHGWTSIPADHGTTAVEALGHALRALEQAARGGQPHPCDARFGADVVRVLAAAQEQLDQNTPG
ncbi:Gfo/Idh/MocA family protein [Aquipuribacter nitratireducens]|uniref:Gfo/Idh/MocA family protein n=1 Tax=Aquipuribacter nitratireducens TaxID=650104 RepID=A0ABW0GQ39_9MICO